MEKNIGHYDISTTNESGNTPAFVEDQRAGIAFRCRCKFSAQAIKDHPGKNSDELIQVQLLRDNLIIVVEPVEKEFLQAPQDGKKSNVTVRFRDEEEKKFEPQMSDGQNGQTSDEDEDMEAIVQIDFSCWHEAKCFLLRINNFDAHRQNFIQKVEQDRVQRQDGAVQEESFQGPGIENGPNLAPQDLDVILCYIVDTPKPFIFNETDRDAAMYLWEEVKGHLNSEDSNLEAKSKSLSDKAAKRIWENRSQNEKDTRLDTTHDRGHEVRGNL